MCQNIFRKQKLLILSSICREILAFEQQIIQNNVLLYLGNIALRPKQNDFVISKQ